MRGFFCDLILETIKTLTISKKQALKHCSFNDESLKLCVATNLTNTDQTIVSKTLKQWRQVKIPDLSKKLCVFLIN